MPEFGRKLGHLTYQNAQFWKERSEKTRSFSAFSLFLGLLGDVGTSNLRCRTVLDGIPTISAVRAEDFSFRWRSSSSRKCSVSARKSPVLVAKVVVVLVEEEVVTVVVGITVTVIVAVGTGFVVVKKVAAIIRLLLLRTTVVVMDLSCHLNYCRHCFLTIIAIAVETATSVVALNRFEVTVITAVKRILKADVTDY